MKYEITYTVQGLMKVFKDVVEATNINEAESELKKLVSSIIGNKSIQIVLIKSL
ncbi:hypothetical protein [Azonexus hydrophilus]|uniref:hypothetical protein n=1 Tax=Azonexus hydrophilus TaxID=418702 RepID=UPI0004242BF2|nr:hypothetical protein [Azonexus hydrophilus]